MNENEIMVAEVERSRASADADARGEFVKFGALIVVFLITIAVVALIAPVVGRIVPAVLGLDAAVSSQAPAIEDSQQNDTPRLENGLEINGNGNEEDENGIENNQNGAGSDEETIAPTPTPRTHVVRAGENLTVIARQYGVTVEAIKQANNIPNPNRIEAGMVLTIP
jgi:LysM repeat protein